MNETEIVNKILREFENRKWTYNLDIDDQGVFLRDCYCATIKHIKAELVDLYGATLILSVERNDCTRRADSKSYVRLFGIRDHHRINFLYERLEKERLGEEREMDEREGKGVIVREMHRDHLETVLELMGVG